MDELTTPAPEEADWPACPGCGQRRLTVCPVCGTSGNDFPRADPQYSGNLLEGKPGGLALICSSCDEPWSADFLRLCEWCDHDFGSGFDFEVKQQDYQDEHELNSRAAVLLLAMVAIAGAVLAYFAFIVSK